MKTETPEQLREKRGCLKVGCLVLALLAVGLVVFVISEMVRGPRIGEHVSREDCPFELPVGASDICYLGPAPFSPSTAYEFDIDEKAFTAWAAKRDWPMSEIEGDSFLIYRYCIGMPDERDALTAEISDGLVYTWHEEDRGRYVAFDRTKGRAYYMSHTR